MEDRVSLLLMKAFSSGFQVELKGENKIKIRGPREAEALAREIARHSEDVARILKLEREIMRLPLNEFRKRGHVLRVFSPRFGELWVISHEGLIKHLEPTEGKVIFTGDELDLLLRRGATEEDMEAVVQGKREFGLRLVEHH